MLKRKIENILLEWKNKDDKKPLIVKGARQVGKTESIRLFAKQNYANYVEIRVPKEALKKIVVGPTNNKMLTVQSIYHFLQINGYDINQIDVVQSHSHSMHLG